MTSTLREPVSPTRDALRSQIAEAIATREGYPAALPIHEQLAKIALVAVDEVMTEQAAELARLHASSMRLSEQLTYARQERDYAFDQMQRQREHHPNQAVSDAPWVPGDPEPGDPVATVRGCRSLRLYDRAQHAEDSRWVNKASGNWFTWEALLRIEHGVTMHRSGGI